MKKLLLLATFLCAPLMINAQIEVGLSNDFEDGTTQGWSNGGSSPNPPINVPDGGPDGAGDNYLEEQSAGGGGAGSRLITFNVSPEWRGDYTAAQADLLRFNVRNSSASETLHIRVGLAGGPDETEMSTTTAEVINTGGDWTEVLIDISAANFTVTGGSDSVETVLSDVDEIRIYSNEEISFRGDNIVGTMDLDNIVVESSLGVDEVQNVSFQLFPNPASSELTITSQNTMSSYRIVNVLGAVVQEGSLNGRSQNLTIASLVSGVYFVEVNTSNGTAVSKLLKN